MSKIWKSNFSPIDRLLSIEIYFLQWTIQFVWLRFVHLSFISALEKNKNLSGFASQKILSSPGSWRGEEVRIVNYDFMSLPHLDQSKLIKRSLALTPQLSLNTEFSLLMKGNALRRTSLVITTSGQGHTGAEIFRLDSVVGGLSRFLGESDPEDDEEANASVQLSLLGLPLRPRQLFSSLGQLMDLYWSGVAEKLSSYLSKSILLLDNVQQLTLRDGTDFSIFLIILYNPPTLTTAKLHSFEVETLKTGLAVTDCS